MKNKTAIIFGGSGYIGRNLLSILIGQNIFSNYIILDLIVLKGYENNKSVSFIKTDVREPIKIILDDIDEKNSWIYNLAAIHREPGHEYHEYFDTNVKGAQNINTFAIKTGIKNLFVTSSIAPYGKSLRQRTEKSNLYPETAYGISKGMVELIHQNWLGEDKEKRLVIVRPSVIYGPKDPGNVYRMISSLKKGTFVLPDGGKVIKAYGYIYGLIDSILFTMSQSDHFILYNYAENPIVPLEEMVRIAKTFLGYKKPTLKLSVKILSILAFFIQILTKVTGKKSDIHPVRVKKAGFPTNIKPEYLIEKKFPFKYDFETSLRHWKSICPTDFD